MSPTKPKKSLLIKIISFILGLIFLGVVSVVALMLYLGISAEPPTEEPGESTPTPQSTPIKLTFPKTYLGKWQATSGTTINIRADGKGDFHFQETDVTGGNLLIDEKKKILKISTSFDLSKTWKINRQPHNKNGRASMTLDTLEFQRVP